MDSIRLCRGRERSRESNSKTLLLTRASRRSDSRLPSSVPKVLHSANPKVLYLLLTFRKRPNSGEQKHIDCIHGPRIFFQGHYWSRAQTIYISEAGGALSEILARRNPGIDTSSSSRVDGVILIDTEDFYDWHLFLSCEDGQRVKRINRYP